MIVDGSKIGGEIVGKDLVRVYFQTDIKTAESVLDSLKKDKQYKVDIKQHRKARSLDANAYCWKLCRKLAEVMGSTDVEVYREQIRHYGLTTIRPERKDLVDDLVRMWDAMGTGNDHDILGECRGENLKDYVNVKYYYGSSKYDTKRMARLIDGLVYECKLQGIETKTPDEIERIKAAWTG